MGVSSSSDALMKVYARVLKGLPHFTLFVILFGSQKDCGDFLMHFFRKVDDPDAR